MVKTLKLKIVSSLKIKRSSKEVEIENRQIANEKNKKIFKILILFNFFRNIIQLSYPLSKAKIQLEKK